VTTLLSNQANTSRVIAAWHEPDVEGLQRTYQENLVRCIAMSTVGSGITKTLKT